MVLGDFRVGGKAYQGYSAKHHVGFISVVIIMSLLAHHIAHVYLLYQKTFTVLIQ